METTLVVCLIFATLLHARSIPSSATSMSTSTTAVPESSSLSEDATTSSSLSADVTTSSSFFDIDQELAKIAASCLSDPDFEQMSGNIIRGMYAEVISVMMAKEAVEIIGLTELRAVLGFAPPGPWTNYRQPSDEEIAAAPTIEAYFELREPRNEMRSLDSRYFFEKNFAPAIMFLDERFPSVRTIFRRQFEEIRRLDGGVTIDRRAVDHMIDEYNAISKRVKDAVKKMVHLDYECIIAIRKREG